LKYKSLLGVWHFFEVVDERKVVCGDELLEGDVGGEVALAEVRGYAGRVRCIIV
jgi:hypothetical protein